MANSKNDTMEAALSILLRLQKLSIDKRAQELEKLSRDGTPAEVIEWVRDGLQFDAGELPSVAETEGLRNSPSHTFT